MPVLAALLLAAATAPAAPSCATGHWISSAAGTPVLGLTVAPLAGKLAATWIRPTAFGLTAAGYSDVRGPVVARRAVAVEARGADLRLRFDDPRPNATPDVFTAHCLGPDRLQLRPEGIPFEPLEFRRIAGVPRLGPWVTGRAYAYAFDRPTSAEMTRLFDEDQQARAGAPATIDWAAVGPADARRRLRTRALLDEGALQSGEDYYHAAFIFQHGDRPDDYLLAHVLAMAAVARGYSSAIWIASGTLDRYLMNSGKPQILGTQFQLPNGKPVTQEPYDRALVSDALRRALQVPSLAEQEKQRADYAREAGGK